MNMKTLRATLREIDPEYRINRHPDRLTVTVNGKEVLIGTGYALINMTRETLMQRIERTWQQ